MPYAVLLLAVASEDPGRRIAGELALQKHHFSRAAALVEPSSRTDSDADKEEAGSLLGPEVLERVTGDWSEAHSYRGFDIVISAVGEDLYLEQRNYMDAAFAGGVKHFYPAECEQLPMKKLKWSC